MKHSIDFVGKRFGRLVVLSKDPNNKSKNTYYICQCDCGNIKSISRPNLRQGTCSCGCYNKELHTKHGLSRHRICKIFVKMVHRCNNPEDKDYKNYGARGIKICDEWLHNVKTFYDWSLKNGYADNLTIDRIDNNGNYEPSNCRWVDNKTQANNRRTNNHVFYEGNKYTIGELAKKLNVSRDYIYNHFETEKKVIPCKKRCKSA